MLSSESIKRQLDECRGIIEQYAASQRALTEMVRQAPPRERTDDLIRRISQAESEMLSDAEIIRVRLKFQVLKHNLQHALLSEIVPAALEILKRYSGKPYGPKTRDKIDQEMRALTGWSMYISNYDYSVQTLHLRAADFSDGLEVISVGSPDRQRVDFLTDNKINTLDPDCLQIVGYNAPYVDNVDARVDDLLSTYAAAAASAAAWRDAVNAFNALTVSGIEHLNPSNPYSAYGTPNIKQ